MDTTVDPKDLSITDEEKEKRLNLSPSSGPSVPVAAAVAPDATRHDERRDFSLEDGSRPFLKAVFEAMGKEVNIDFIDTPIDIRDKYQYFTEANMNKLIESGYKERFTGLEEGVTEYVNNYLKPDLSF